MTNFEHMTEEEKKLAIIKGLYVNKDGEVKFCPSSICRNCNAYINKDCKNYLLQEERAAWLDAEYVAPKTANEKFCETLKVGEVIAVWNDLGLGTEYHVFEGYDEDHDYIETEHNFWRYGRKLTAEERGEVADDK